MLLILYGAVGKMGHESRLYLKNAGFPVLEKLNYAEKPPQLSTMYGTRNYVTREEFLENTDSLFRYEVGGIQVGFHQQQISDAVCDKEDVLLSLSTRDISFLKDIKRVYGDKVCLIYAYIDETTLENIVKALPDIQPQQVQARLEIGRDVKKCYQENIRMFDRVVIYGGEDSLFNMQSLLRQYDGIIQSLRSAKEKAVGQWDVFLSCAAADSPVAEQVTRELTQKGITVITPAETAKGTVDREIAQCKIFVPLITKNVMKSPFARQELHAAMTRAEQNGLVLLPLFADTPQTLAGDMLPLATVSSIRAGEQGQDMAQAARALAEKVYDLLDGENRLQVLSRQVDNYIAVSIHSQAAQAQQKHVQLCDRLCAASNGTVVPVEQCKQSRVKLAGIYMDMGQPDQALESVIDALNLDNEVTGKLQELFGLCCVQLDMTTEQTQALIRERTAGALGAFGQAFTEDLMDGYRQQKRAKDSTQSYREERTSHLREEDRIAEYGELVIGLFEELLSQESQNPSSHDLILGYERILNYCKHMGIKGPVAEQCIRRITQLTEKLEQRTEQPATDHCEALKIYLGQATPQSGSYDVFISYKSEDVLLAQKVYDYLTQCGKEVFFSKMTLAELGESKYADMIYEAIDRSRHMLVVSSDPDYLKTKWVKDEWMTFRNELLEGRKKGNLTLVLSDDVAGDKGRLPVQLRASEIVLMSQFRARLLSYVR